MSFSLTFNGHAGPGMEANGPDEIAAVQAVVRVTREAFAAWGLELGSVSAPFGWLADDLREPQYLPAKG